jgi:hypothetical protein
VRVAFGAGRFLERGEALTRRARPDEVEAVEVRVLEMLERVGPYEGVTAVVGLMLEVDADDAETSLPQAARCATGAAVEIERVHRGSSPRPARPG